MLGSSCGADHETLCFDETGVAGTDSLFVVAGYAVRGDPGRVATGWKSVLSSGLAARLKGRKLSDDDLARVAEFLRSEGVLPIATHSRLSVADRLRAKSKLKELERLKGLRYRVPSYLWVMQVAFTLGPALAVILLDHGAVSKLSVSLDQMSMPEGLRTMANLLLRRGLSRERLADVCADEQVAPLPGAAALLDKALYSDEDVSIEWKARGELGQLADVVCAMYRRFVDSDGNGTTAWELAQPDKARRTCLGRDVTTDVRDSLRRPWPPQRVGR